MRRRVFLEIVASGSAAIVTAPPLQARPAGIVEANNFATAYKEWGPLYEHRVPGTLDLHELRSWRIVKERFSALRKYIDLEYSE